MSPNRSSVQHPSDESDPEDDEVDEEEPALHVHHNNENQVALLENHLPEPDHEGHQTQANNHNHMHLYVRQLIAVISLIVVYVLELLCWAISLLYRTIIILMIL